MQSNQWVDRYVHEVGRLVPKDKRNDIELEIRSLIQDEIDALPQSDATTMEAATLEILSEFGRPNAIAARYGATQVLIGPALYPTFVTVLRIVLAITLGLTLLGVAVGIGLEGTEVSLLDTLSSLMGSLFQSAGIVVLIFALLERVNGVEQAARSQVWDPRSLPAVEVGDRLKWGELVTEVTFAILAIVYFNFYLDSLGGYWADGEWNRIAIFSEEFAAFVPWFTALWSLQVLLAVAVMIRGRWEVLTRWLSILLSVGGLGILYMMLVGAPLAAWPPVEPAFKVVVAVIAVFTVFDIVRDVMALMGRGGGKTVEIVPASGNGGQRKVTP